MHNSQDGSPLNFDVSLTQNRYLTRGTCLGCHAQGPTMIVDGIPQVRHEDPARDLAGGNFAYMLGTKGSGASDAKGHNVIDFGDLEDTLTGPPGGWIHGLESKPAVEDFTCAGIYGCHGRPLDYGASDPMASIAGAHHGNGSTLNGTTVARSYRFLYGVIGLEADDWQNTDSAHHNEYYGATTPRTPACNDCHTLGSSFPTGSTITSLCTTCHPDMHEIDNGGDGIWIRHPSDIVIPDTGEYADYTTYNVAAPVGRVTVPAAAGDTVTPGEDVVTCLSCHVAHSSDYPDLLRWDYGQIVAGGGESGEGCFICHSTKD
ncbi:MAG: hypothetical protein JXO49_08715 [Deltaproteobacteria bacterium]|nr:hypothetical protein [Candidatus Anaeroferrophillus wilburensis]MBN2889410.1 hypothetical protein [Deltaproteobacteria bacterium]